MEVRLLIRAHEGKNPAVGVAALPRTPQTACQAEAAGVLASCGSAPVRQRVVSSTGTEGAATRARKRAVPLPLTSVRPALHAIARPTISCPDERPVQVDRFRVLSRNYSLINWTRWRGKVSTIFWDALADDVARQATPSEMAILVAQRFRDWAAIFRRRFKMQLGMIGLGRMGASMVRRPTREGHECVVDEKRAREA